MRGAGERETRGGHLSGERAWGGRVNVLRVCRHAPGDPREIGSDLRKGGRGVRPRGVHVRDLVFPQAVRERDRPEQDAEGSRGGRDEGPGDLPAGADRRGACAP